jgi:hypothetical protein
MKRRVPIIIIMTWYLSACGGGQPTSTSQIDARTASQFTSMVTPRPETPKTEIPKPKQVTPVDGQTPTITKNPDRKEPPCPACADILKGQKLGTISTHDSALAALKGLRQNSFLKPLETYSRNRLHTTIDLLNPENRQKSQASDLPIASIDTGAADAWKMGWTGKQVKMAVVDDYCDWGEEISHGERTRGVALQVAPEADIVSYHYPLTDQSNCPKTLSGSLFQDRQVNRIFQDDWDAFKFAAAENVRVVSSSFSPDPGDFSRIMERGKNRATYQDFLKFAKPSTLEGSLNPQTLFVFSAGNDGKRVPQRNRQS